MTASKSSPNRSISILGISAFYHDSAAALVVDGEIVAAAQEERFTRVKHDPDFPARALEYCLAKGRLEADQLDYVAFSEKPLVKFDRLLETYLAFAPRGFQSFRRAIPVWLKKKLNMRRLIREGLGGAKSPKLVFLDHHESHAASAFFPSPFEEAAIVTADAVGEWSTMSWGHGEGNRIRLEKHIPFPHSLGMLYSAFTYYCGFRVNSGEYKLMGLAPYGEPRFRDAILEHLIDLRDDGSFWLDMDYFNYCQGLTMTGSRFHDLFGGPPRKSESSLDQRHMDLAASIQSVTEEVMMRVTAEAHRRTGSKNLVLAGGVSLNCVANGRILREGPFEKVWIQPAAGDAGGALGSALFVWHQLLEKQRVPTGSDFQKGSLLGPEAAREEIRGLLEKENADAKEITDEDELLEIVAGAIADQKVVGWFQGRMEFGPRALGCRSILGDARSSEMQAVMNLKIKFRESFRPFAPVVLAERAAEWFEIDEGQESPYMLLTADVLADRRIGLTEEQERTLKLDPDLRARVNVPRSTIPAVTHLDYSARLQTVDRERHGRFYRLLKAFEALTGCPVMVNTSFNVRGEPIVCTPEDAYRCFLATEMDLLVMEDFVVVKREADRRKQPGIRDEHIQKFNLD